MEIYGGALGGIGKKKEHAAKKLAQYIQSGFKDRHDFDLHVIENTKQNLVIDHLVNAQW